MNVLIAAGGTFEMPANDVRLKAVYGYTLTFMLNAPEGVAPSVDMLAGHAAEAGGTFTVAAEDILSDQNNAYRFLGWSAVTLHGLCFEFRSHPDHRVGW